MVTGVYTSGTSDLFSINDCYHRKKIFVHVYNAYIYGCFYNAENTLIRNSRYVLYVKCWCSNVLITTEDKCQIIFKLIIYIIYHNSCRL